jgi:ketosteroid isomerase-like protein
VKDDHPIAKALIAAGLYRPGESARKADLSGLPSAPAGDPDARRYAEKALEYEADEVGKAGEGSRNDTLNRAAFKLGSLVAAGHLDGQAVIDTLSAAARASGLPASEVNRVVYRAANAGAKEPRDVKLESRDTLPATYTLSAVPTGGEVTAEPPSPPEATDGIADLYPVLDWPTVWAQAPDDVEWIAYPVFERGRLYSLYSPAKAGKSLFTLDVCAAIATGRPVLGNPPGDPLTVLYVDLENAPSDLVDRLQDLGYEPHQLGRLKYLSFPNLPALDSHAGGQHLLAVALHYEADVIVIDTVSRTIAGKENDSDTFHALYRYAMAPLKAIQKTVIRLDHAGKDEEKGMRGSSAKVSDVDAAWKLSRTGDGRLRLDRTATRNTHSPEYVVIDQRDSPLQHVLVDSTVSDDVMHLVNALDRLGIPGGWGREKCRSALATAGYKVRNNLLSEAIRVRKTTFREAS